MQSGSLPVSGQKQAFSNPAQSIPKLDGQYPPIIIANDQEITPTGTRLSDTPCADFSQKQLQALIQEFSTVFTDSPGISNVAPAHISIPPDTPVISQASLNRSNPTFSLKFSITTCEKA